MKKSRRALSLILSLLVAMGSMPIVYTATGAADYRSVSDIEIGTAENPTKPVLQETSFSYSDMYKVNVSYSNINFHYYQKVDGEYFRLKQDFTFQQVYSDASSRTTTFVGNSFYEGASQTTPTSDNPSLGSASNGNNGIYEYSVITANTTKLFREKYLYSDTWTPTNDHAIEKTDGRTDKSPADFTMQGSTFDWGGCEPYTWNNAVVFKGADAGESFEATNFYRQFNWKWNSNSDTSTVYNLTFRAVANINIIDAREFYEQLVKYQNILNNSQKYTEEYISSVKATFEAIPDDLEDFSALYTQEQVDQYTEYFKKISLNSADYSVYNEYYSQLQALDNHMGSWTAESFAQFKAEIERIDSGLDKNLDKTKQSTVDQATQALADAYNSILVSTDVSTENVGWNYSYVSDAEVDGNMSYSVDNTAFKFMQTKDNQVFQYEQNWTMRLNSGDIARHFRGLTFDKAYPLTCGSDCLSMPTLTENKTQEFISNYLSTNSYTEYSAKNENDTSVSSTELSCWWEYQEDGAPNETSTFVDSTGTLDSDRNFEFSAGKTYYLKNSPQIKGNPAGTYGELNLQYVLRTGWRWKTGGLWGLGGTQHSAHIHVNNTIVITDVRPLIATVDEANAIIANPAGYSDQYISALSAAVSAAPQYMLYGSEFYSQAEVDAVDAHIRSVLTAGDMGEGSYADYTEFNETFEKLTNVEFSQNFTAESFEAFQKSIYQINQNLDKGLSADQQSTVDSAVDSLYAAYSNLVYVKLNNDNSLSQDEVGDGLESSNNPLSFTVYSTQHKFMQILDNQKFSVKTSIEVENIKNNYIARTISMKLSGLDGDPSSANYYNNLCPNRGDSTDDGCHNGSTVARNDYQTLISNVTSGLNVFSTANEAGDVAEFNTWKNTYGISLSSGGIFSDSSPDLKDGSTSGAAVAEMVYQGVSGNSETSSPTHLEYALRFGWSYEETSGIFGTAFSETAKHHVHIPVTLDITDARALYSLYLETENILSGNSDKTYTMATLVNLYNAYLAVPNAMAMGESYYSQEDVDAVYASLKAAYDDLTEGADYSEYFEELSLAQAIYGTNNTDGFGNALYVQSAFDEFTAVVDSVYANTDQNLSDTPENQAIIDNATLTLKTARETLEQSKRADYSKFSEALEQAHKIVDSPEGTYTQATLDTVNAAINTANGLDTELSATPENQAVIDAATANLNTAIENSLFMVDYTEYNTEKAKADAVNNDDGTYNKTAYEAFLAEIQRIDNGLDKDLPDYQVNREKVSSSAQAVRDALYELENNRNADYTEFDAYKAQVQAILDAPENTYTDKTLAAAQAAMNTANSVPAGMVVGEGNANQIIINNAAAELKAMLDTAQEKADYTEFETLLPQIEAIVNAPAGTYTDKTVQAATNALNAANALDKDLDIGQQAAVDSVVNAMQSALGNAQQKADYTEFNSAKAQLEAIVNAPAGTYTDKTVAAAQQALTDASTLDMDLGTPDQGIIDEMTNSMNEVLANAQEKADYTGYNDAKAEAEALINGGNDDGNGNPIYDEEEFEALRDIITNVDNNLDKDLGTADQDIVDGAADTLTNMTDSVLARKYYTITFNDENDVLITSFRYIGTTLLSDVGAPALPADSETITYVGWADSSDTFVPATTALSGDITLKIAKEFKALDLKEDAGYIVDEEKDSYRIEQDDEITYDEIVTKFENDFTVVEVKDYLGNELQSTDMIGSGSTITLKSKYTGVIYETKTFVIEGDVNGDGVVDTADFEISKQVGIKAVSYSEENWYFFQANDIDCDGVIDVVDTTLIRKYFKYYKVQA